MQEREIGHLIRHVTDDEMVEVHVSPGEYQCQLPTRSKVFVNGFGRVTRIENPDGTETAPAGSPVYLDSLNDSQQPGKGQ